MSAPCCKLTAQLHPCHPFCAAFFGVPPAGNSAEVSFLQCREAAKRTYLAYLLKP